MRDLMPLFEPPANPSAIYKPGPQPEGTVRVVLSPADYEEPADCVTYDEYPLLVQAYRVYDLPADLVERWQATKRAFDHMQEEIEALISARARATAERHG